MEIEDPKGAFEGVQVLAGFFWKWNILEAFYKLGVKNFLLQNKSLKKCFFFLTLICLLASSPPPSLSLPHCNKFD